MRTPTALRVLGAAAVSSCLLLGAGRAEACSVCGCADPLVSAGDSSPTAGRLRLSLDYEYLTAAARSDEDPDAVESLRQMTLRPVLVFSPLQRLNLVLQVPVVRKDWALVSDGELGIPSEVESAQPMGLGDLDLGARYFFATPVDMPHQRRQAVALSAGTSLPTGRNDLEVEGVRLDDHAQLGTGGFGPYVGVLYAFHQDPWNLSVDAYFRTRTRNAYGYKYGDALLWNAELALRPWERVAFAAALDGRYAARDQLDDELQANTGGLVLYATPGVMVNLFGDVWLHARAQLPVFAHLFGDQRVGPTFLASLAYDPK